MIEQKSCHLLDLLTTQSTTRSWHFLIGNLMVTIDDDNDDDDDDDDDDADDNSNADDDDDDGDDDGNRNNHNDDDNTTTIMNCLHNVKNSYQQGSLRKALA